MTAEAFGAGRKGQNCPQTPRISISPYGQSCSYLSQVALSGSAVDLLADGLEVGWNKHPVVVSDSSGARLVVV